MAKKIILLLTLAVLMLSFTAVFADQDGHDCWCNSDEYGCWVTDEDGGKCYIMFWSEEARAFFMGDKTRPGTLVTEKPDSAGGRFKMDPVKGPKNYKDEFIALIIKYGQTVEGELEYWKAQDFISQEQYEYTKNWYESHHTS